MNRLGRFALTATRQLGWFVLFVALTVACGALVGAILFPLSGLVFGDSRPVAALIWAGMKTFGFWALVWAPGISIVLVFVRAARRNKWETA